MKVVNFHHEGEGYKNSQCLNYILPVRKSVRKWKINRTVEFKARSRRSRKMSDRMA